jgi:hypothetical protein
MEGLGDQLARIEAAEAEQRAATEAMRRRAMEGAEQQRRHGVSSSFEQWKRDATNAILAGKRPLQLPVSVWIAGSERCVITNPKHRDHDLFLELKHWANSQGLDIKLNLNQLHDGNPLLELISLRASEDHQPG